MLVHSIASRLRNPLAARHESSESQLCDVGQALHWVEIELSLLATIRSATERTPQGESIAPGLEALSDMLPIPDHR